MSKKWRGLEQITAEAAEREPEHVRIFGPSFDARQRRYAAERQQSGINKAKYRPWKKPQIVRPK